MARILGFGRDVGCAAQRTDMRLRDFVKKIREKVGRKKDPEQQQQQPPQAQALQEPQPFSPSRTSTGWPDSVPYRMPRNEPPFYVMHQAPPDTRSEKPNRVFSFRTQRVLFTLFILGLAFVFTTSVLWGHIESVIRVSNYQTLAKVGLLLLPAVAFVLTIWELFVDDVDAKRKHKVHPTVVRLVNWCFYAAYGLMIAELIHAGALLKYESSIQEQTANVQTAADAAAKVEGAKVAAGIRAAGQAAAAIKRETGDTGLANRALQLGKQENRKTKPKQGGEQSAPDKALAIKGQTFLSDWYVQGGMYVALPCLAALCFAITMFFARAARPYVDADDDGIPDARQGQPFVQGPPPVQPYPGYGYPPAGPGWGYQGLPPVMMERAYNPHDRYDWIIRTGGVNDSRLQEPEMQEVAQDRAEAYRRHLEYLDRATGAGNRQAPGFGTPTTAAPVATAKKDDDDPKK